MRTIIWFLNGYIFYYPLLTCVLWIMGGLAYSYRMKHKKDEEAASLPESAPFVSVLVPARNEDSHIEGTIRSILDSSYTNFEIIVINDASQDETKETVSRLMADHGRISRLLDLEENMGKASALNYALLVSRGDIIVTVDADCLLERDCISRMVRHFVRYPRVGAITGNPRIKNQEGLLPRIQSAEYSSIIGLIKRSQRVLGKLFTVSGVVAAFRKRALVDAGLWSDNMLTEDIDITWKLESKFWDVRYEESAYCGIIAPETLPGLFRQRMRWCGGGAQVIKKHRGVMKNLKMRRMWPIYIDYILSIVWAYAFVICLCFWLFQSVFHISTPWASLGNATPYWKGGVLAAVCLVQMLIGIVLDKRSESGVFRAYFYSIWFPVIYWFLYSISVVIATPVGLFNKLDGPAIWISPERGAAAPVKLSKKR